jgi:hypothetical protein
MQLKIQMQKGYRLYMQQDKKKKSKYNFIIFNQSFFLFFKKSEKGSNLQFQSRNSNELVLSTVTLARDHVNFNLISSVLILSRI